MNDNVMQVQEKPAEPTALKTECGAVDPAKEAPPCTFPQAPAAPGPTAKFPGKPASSVPYPSVMITSGSGRDTQTRLLSSGGMRPGSEKDEYLLRLLGKGGRPPAPASLPGPSSGFRMPDPVPPRAAQAAARAAAPALPTAAAAAAPEKGSAPSALPTPALGNTNTASGQPISEVAPGWSYADTRRRMGAAPAAALRATVVSHQVAFLEQLYDLHRAIAVQKLLVRTCPEVKPLMAEAARILISASSGQREPLVAPPAKRRRVGEPPRGAAAPSGPVAMATDAVPASAAEEEPELRPDSQFAAVPLPGETAATGDGSGDDGDGSGPNGSGGGGSGGGSNSPQPGVPVAMQPPMPPRRLALLQPAPSGASQTPMAFPRAPMMAAAVPWGTYPPMGSMTPAAAMQMHMQMQMQMAGAPAMGYPPAAAAAAPEGAAAYPYTNGAGFMGYPAQAGPAVPAGAPGGASAGAGAPAGGAAAPVPVPPSVGATSAAVAAAGGDPMAYWYHNYYGRQQLAQAQAAAVAAAQAMPPPPAPAPAQAMAGAGPSARWWHDCHATFGPAADPAVLAAACKAAAGEAESAPPSATGPCSGPGVPGTVPPVKKTVSLPPLPPRRPKRKPSDPIEEASSGTTGQDHHLGPHAVADDAHFKSRSPRPTSTPGKKAAMATSPQAAADTTAARLLLSMSGKAI